jgi:hypothetical protein
LVEGKNFQGGSKTVPLVECFEYSGVVRSTHLKLKDAEKLPAQPPNHITEKIQPVRARVKVTDHTFSDKH